VGAAVSTHIESPAPEARLNRPIRDPSGPSRLIGGPRRCTMTRGHCHRNEGEHECGHLAPGSSCVLHTDGILKPPAFFAPDQTHASQAACSLNYRPFPIE